LYRVDGGGIISFGKKKVFCLFLRQEFQEQLSPRVVAGLCEVFLEKGQVLRVNEPFHDDLLVGAQSYL